MQDTLDCISKYNVLQSYCGFNEGLCVTEESRILPENTSCIRLAVSGIAKGLEVRTGIPSSKVVFKVNGFPYAELISDKDGVSTFRFIVNFSRIHCSQIISDNLLAYSLLR
jgi:hypothetical protein